MSPIRLGALALMCFPAAASAIMTIDDIRWPQTGAFPAYPEELSAAATGRRLHAYVYGGLYHDSNLLRLPSGFNTSFSKSEDFSKLGVGARADLAISRQRLLLEGQIDENRFHNFSELDNTGGRASATWNWELGNNWSGSLGASKDRALSGFGQIVSATVIKDMVDQDRGFANAAFRITPDWRVRAGVASYRYEHDGPGRSFLDSEQTDTILGADYVTPLQNSLGVQWRNSRGDFPNLQQVTPTLTNSHYKEDEPSVVLHYNLGGKSSVDGRLGVTHRTYDEPGQRDFRGATGNFAFHWTPTPKTLLDVTAFRETRPFTTNSIGSSLSSFNSTASYVVSRGISFAPHWAVTDQLVLQAQLIEERDTYQGDPTTATLREDKFRAGSVSVGWTPLRPLLLSLSLERGKRTSNGGFDFDYNTVSANARYTFF